MGTIIRQSIQNTIISYVGVGLGFVSTILMYPHILEDQQFGLTRVLISITFISTQFANLGLKHTIIRYFPYFKSSNESRESLLTLSLIVSVIGFTLFAGGILLIDQWLVAFYRDDSALFGKYYLFLIPLVLFILLFDTLNSYLRALQDSVTGSFLNEIVMRVKDIALLAIYYFGWIDFFSFILLFTVSYAIPPLYMFGYLYVRNELTFALPFQGSTRRHLKGMVRYSLFSLMGGLATHLVGNIDIIMLGAMTDLGSTAVYAIAFYVGSVISIPQRSIGKIAAPILADLIKDKKFDQVSSLYKRTSLTQIIAGSLLLVGIWANMHNLMALLPPKYQDGEWVIIIVGFAKLFAMATGINGSIIINSRYYRVDLYTNIFLVVLTIATNYLLIPIYGLEGAAVATAISIFLHNLVKFIFVWYKFSMQPFQWNALAVLVIAAGCLLMSFQIPYLGSFIMDVAIRSLAIASVFLGLILIFGLSDDVQQLVKESLRRVRAFLN